MIGVGKSGLLSSVMTMFAVLCCVPQFGWCQVTIGPDGPVAAKPPSEEVDLPGRRELTVSAAAEPVPALRYSFRFAPHEQTPGNAVTFYYRAFAAMASQPRDAQDQLYDLVDKDYDQLVSADAGKLLERFEPIYKALDTAVRRETCEWDWRLHRGDGVRQTLHAMQFVMDELSTARDVARLLAVTSRWSCGLRDFEGAIGTLRMGYLMAEDISRSETVISGLVANAIVAIMNDELLHLIDTPGSPNLYWAVAELPRPPSDLRPAIRAELEMVQRFFHEAYDEDVDKRSAEQWRATLFDVEELLDLSGDQEDRVLRRGSLVTGLAMLGYARAKRLLLDQGYEVEQIEAMPVGQVIALHQAYSNRVAIDNLLKWSYLPYDQAWKYAQQASDDFRMHCVFESPYDTAEVLPIGTMLVPALNAAGTSQMRSWADVNAIQAVEALRMHAADHAGRFPATLDEVTVVPVPRNPLNNQPFGYQRTESGAELTMAAENLIEPYHKQFVLSIDP